MPRLEMRDLRSLERRSMYSIFAPLNADDRLPRELILEGKRHRRFEMRYIELFGVLCLPALILAILVLESVGVNAQVAFGVAGLMFMGFFLYAAYAKYR